MKKSDKKIDNKIRKALIEVCDIALETIEGYQWISHKVNYNAFPESLQIVCAFTSQPILDTLKRSKQELAFNQLIEQKLIGIGVNIKNIEKQVTYVVA